MGLIQKLPGGYRARREAILAFLPMRADPGLDGEVDDEADLTSDAQSL
jgi:hypothetical protein